MKKNYKVIIELMIYESYIPILMRYKLFYK